MPRVLKTPKNCFPSPFCQRNGYPQEAVKTPCECGWLYVQVMIEKEKKSIYTLEELVVRK